MRIVIFLATICCLVSLEKTYSQIRKSIIQAKDQQSTDAINREASALYQFNRYGSTYNKRIYRTQVSRELSRIGDSIKLSEVTIKIDSPHIKLIPKIDTIKMKLARKGDVWLYDSLKAGKFIENTFIEELDLSRLCKVIDSSVYITCAIQLRNCIVVRFKLPSGFDFRPYSGDPKTPYKKFIISRKFIIFNTAFDKYLSFYNTEFKDEVHIEDISFSGYNTHLRIEDCVFDKNFYYGSHPQLDKSLDADFRYYNTHVNVPTIPAAWRSPDWAINIDIGNSPSAIIVNNNFKRSMYFYNSDSLNYNILIGNIILGRTSFHNFHQWFNSENIHATKYFYPIERLYDLRDTEKAFNIELGNSQFIGGFDSQNIHFVNSSFNNCSFHEISVLYNTRFDRPKPFAQTFFSDECELVLNPSNFNLDSLGLSYSALMAVKIPFSEETKEYTEQEKQACHDFYLRLTSFFKNSLNNNNDITNELISKANYEKAKYDYKYALSNFDFIQLLWLTFMKIVFNNGYHGELSFFMSSLLIIISFALKYLMAFRNEIKKFVTKEYMENDPAFVSSSSKAGDFGICIWFSFLIFLNPRFPPKLFKLKESFLKFVFTEWIIGLIMLVLYFVFIASKYPFIQALLGI